MKLADLPTPAPGPNQALVRIAAIGVNYIDVYFRTGLYKADFPVAIGMEASGVVESIGGGVTGVAPGDRVAYAMARGAYATHQLVPAWQLVKVPPAIGFESAAAAMLQGMTAHYLVHSTFPVAPGHTILIHAAAGGAGLLVVQMARMLGARVIATVGTPAKAALARAAGADETILYNDVDIESEVKRLCAGGSLPDAVYDSVGATTFMKSLNCLKPRGTLVLFGQSSGAVPPFDPGLLAAKGSLYLTRPSLAAYTATREELLARAGDVLGWVESGRLKLRIDRTYPLSEAASAHRDLESRKTSGKLLLLPE
jgi:NADPH2:quinone reductase